MKVVQMLGAILFIAVFQADTFFRRDPVPLWDDVFRCAVFGVFYAGTGAAFRPKALNPRNPS